MGSSSTLGPRPLLLLLPPLSLHLHLSLSLSLSFSLPCRRFLTLLLLLFSLDQSRCCGECFGERDEEMETVSEFTFFFSRHAGRPHPSAAPLLYLFLFTCPPFC